MTDKTTPTAPDDLAWIDDLLVAAAPVTDARLAELDLDEGFAHVLARIEAAGPGDRRRWYRRFRARVVVPAALVGALLVGAAFTAPVQHGIAHALTGVFGKPGYTENDTSEYVDSRKPDFPAAAHRLADQMRGEGLRYAPGFDGPTLIDQQIAAMHASGSRFQVTGIRGQFAEAAMCTWDQSFLDAADAGNPSGMGAATAGMRDLLRMPIFGQINDAGWQAGLVAAAEHGDVERIHTQVTLNCGPEPRS